MNWIFDRIRDFGNSEAIIFNNKINTYFELYDQIEIYYQIVLKRIVQGSVVAILSDYSFPSIALFFALYKNRNIIVPIAARNIGEINEKVNEANCDFRISIDENKLQIVEINNKSLDHDLIKQLKLQIRAGLILFSSGSTGKPKTMVHDLDNLIDSYRGKKGKRIVFLIFLMFDHIGGLNTMFNCISMGVTMVFPINRNPEEVCNLIEKYKINILPASPTFLNLILISETYNRYDLSSLRMITYGTEPMPESLLLQLKSIFPRIKFLQTFGTSETGIMQVSSRSSDSTYLKIDDPNSEYKIVNCELWIKSKTQILGYLNYSMDQFTSDGWFRTGDIVEESEDGFIKIIGRNKEIINVGGEKVLPSEVESVLLQLPIIQDCIVYGEINPIIGQMVAVKVLTSLDIKISDLKKEIQLFCKDKLAPYKIPIRVRLMEELEYTDRFKKKRNLS